MKIKLTLTDTTSLEVELPTCKTLTEVRTFLNELGPWITVNENKLINQVHITKIETI